jgi:hypothetical protein
MSGQTRAAGKRALTGGRSTWEACSSCGSSCCCGGCWKAWQVRARAARGRRCDGGRPACCAAGDSGGEPRERPGRGRTAREGISAQYRYAWPNVGPARGSAACSPPHSAWVPRPVRHGPHCPRALLGPTRPSAARLCATRDRLCRPRLLRPSAQALSIMTLNPEGRQRVCLAGAAPPLIA